MTDLETSLDRTFDRRRALQLLGGAGLIAALAACSSTTSDTSSATQAPATTGDTATTGSSGTTATSATSSGSIGKIPEETAGPYPGDGSNGLDVLSEDGVVRADIRSSFGSAGSNTADGVPATISFTVVDASTGAPRSGAAVYVWHCDREGRYSGYSQGAESENYLRGVQPTDDNGVASFTSIYPACYAGRWPHVHFEVYGSVDDATSGGAKLATSQIALTEDVSDTVYAESGYEQSQRNVSQVSLATDMVFRDGVELETPTVSGSVSDGYAIALKVGV
jgi:protocatechuate 3,4-dioxygenase beta subunit